MEKKEKFYQKWWFWLIVFVVCVSLFGSNNSQPTSKTETHRDKTVETKEEKIAFLKNTSAKDFFNILCTVSGLTPSDPKETTCSSVVEYVAFDVNYQVIVYANAKTDEVMQFSIATIRGNNPSNVFMAANRLDYNGKDAAKLTDFITNNIGKKGELTIGDLIFKTWIVEYGDPANRPCFSGETLGYEEYFDACLK